ncbi:DUF2490 domain-containing protein [Draconibacterium sp. IB214405]|nr:DUF2490 domain-containing protein [Draconibacterium sp. IB214405]
MALLITSQLHSMAQNSTDKWDNELWTGARLVMGQSKWIYSVEYQTRFSQDMRQLDRWYLEGAARYLAGNHFEIVPDFRYSIRTSANECRFGTGVIYKTMFKRLRFINQFKAQIDIPVGKSTSYGIRNIIYFNYLLNEKWTPYIGGGPLYRIGERYTGFEVIRFGGGFHYKIDPKHLVSLNYYVGSRDTGEEILWNGVLFIQFTFTLNKEFRYVPAKTIDF